jgi:hypothetical protein
MVANLTDVLVLAVYARVSVPLLLPLAGVTVHHAVALEDAVQAILEVTPTDAEPAANVAEPDAALNVREAEFPACVRVYV